MNATRNAIKWTAIPDNVFILSSVESLATMWMTSILRVICSVTNFFSYAHIWVVCSHIWAFRRMSFVFYRYLVMLHFIVLKFAILVARAFLPYCMSFNFPCKKFQIIRKTIFLFSSNFNFVYFLGIRSLMKLNRHSVVSDQWCENKVNGRALGQKTNTNLWDRTEAGAEWTLCGVLYKVSNVLNHAWYGFQVPLRYRYIRV